MKAPIFRFLLPMAIVFSLAFTCNSRSNDISYFIRGEVYLSDTARMFDQVYNVEHNRLLWTWIRTSTTRDTISLRIPVNPESEKSTFLFKRQSAPADTVVIAHNFQEAICENDEYCFELVSAEVLYSSFGNRFILKTDSWFMQAVLDLR